MKKFKGVIITNAYYDTDNTRRQALRIKEELETLGAEISVVKNNGAYCAVSDIFENVFDFDFAVYFDKDVLVAKALEKAGIRVFNSSSAIEKCDDKMRTALEVSSSVSMPTTIAGSFSYGKVDEVDQDYLNQVEQILGEYPYVVKKNSSSLGAGVYLVDSRENLIEKLKELSGERYLIQEFVRESAGRDVRIIVVGGKAVATMKRESFIDFRSNAELGGECKSIVASSAFVAIAEQVAKSLSLDYCGVDLLINKDGEPMLCEVNSNAFFGAIERVTGVNVARLYAEYIISELQKDFDAERN